MCLWGNEWVSHLQSCPAGQPCCIGSLSPVHARPCEASREQALAGLWFGSVSIYFLFTPPGKNNYRSSSNMFDDNGKRSSDLINPNNQDDIPHIPTNNKKDRRNGGRTRKYGQGQFLQTFGPSCKKPWLVWRTGLDQFWQKALPRRLLMLTHAIRAWDHVCWGRVCNTAMLEVGQDAGVSLQGMPHHS